MQRWDVQVLFGASDVEASGPVGFGTPQVLVGDGETSDVMVPLIYQDVMVRSGGSGGRWMGIQTEQDRPGFLVTHREMRQVFSVEFGDFGEIRVEGIELGEGMQTHFAVWELTPHQPDEEE